MNNSLRLKRSSCSLETIAILAQEQNSEVRWDKFISHSCLGCVCVGRSSLKWHFFFHFGLYNHNYTVLTFSHSVWFHVLTRLHNFRTESLIFSHKAKPWKGEEERKILRSKLIIKILCLTFMVFWWFLFIIFSGFERDGMMFFLMEFDFIVVNQGVIFLHQFFRFVCN